MPKIYTPKALTETQVNDVIVMSLTGEQHEMLEYDEQTKMISDNLGAVGYLYEDGAIGVSEIGVVMFLTTLMSCFKTGIC